MSQEALDLLFGMVLEDGRRWGDAAADFQIEDAKAILLNERPDPTWHFLTRARGGSKSTDVGAISIAWLVEDAPPLSNGHIVAASTDQASIVIDAAHGLIARTPELADALVAESVRLRAPNGAWVEVLAQSDSGAWGLRDARLIVADEFCQWPETRGAKRVWQALQSAAPKVPNCKLIAMSSAGEPSHWTRDVLEKAQTNPLWRVNEVPGPVPWLNAEELEALKWDLPPSAYERLVLNIWSEAEDRAVSEEDWNYAARDYSSLSPQPNIRYIIAVDIGILNDASVMVIAHKEPIDDQARFGPHRVVVDHVERWKGSKKKPINPSDVEDWLVQQAPRWNRATVYADPDQFRGNVLNLNRRGVRAKEFPFTATSVGTVATALVQTFRSRQIYVPARPPAGPVLKDELLRVRLRESAPGVTRLDHDRGGHDDQAVTVGMACKLLLGNAGAIGANFREFMIRDSERQLQKRTERGRQDDAKSRLERRMNNRREVVRRTRRREREECLHRWSPDGSYCVFCFTPKPEEVPV